MKAEQFQEAMALYAEADQRATASLIELVVATVLRKTAEPLDGETSHVSLSPADLEETAHDFLVDTSYTDEGEMSLHLTRLIRK
ncbi:MAG TPA: hypothetical protein VK181_09740 [Rhizobium sp.]|nr:hypothetical protein [Rhizobium sp.]